MKFIMKNKKATIAVIAFLLLMVAVGQLTSVFLTTGTAVYGNRLDGIEEVELTDAKQDKIIASLTEKVEVEDTTIRLSGRIIEIISTVTNETTLDQAKALTTTIIENLTEEEVAFYDIQLFVQKTDESTQFPIIGYKNRESETFSWTKDRE